MPSVAAKKKKKHDDQRYVALGLSVWGTIGSGRDLGTREHRPCLEKTVAVQVQTIASLNTQC